MLNSLFSKIIFFVCLISIALNIWFIGFMLGDEAGRYTHGDKSKESRFERRIEMLTSDLPPESRNQFIENMKRYMAGIDGDFWKNLEELNYRLAECIRSEIVDAECARNTLSEIRANMSAAHMKFHEGLVNAVQELSTEERKLVAETIEKKK